MSYQLVFTETYNRRAARWLKRHPALRQQYVKALQGEGRVCWIMTKGISLDHGALRYNFTPQRAAAFH